jgi:5-methylthioribose kinase
MNWISETIKDVIDLFTQKLNKKFDDIVTFDLYNNKFKQHYIKSILSDSIGFAGTEIIRRVVGDSKVLEVTLVDDIKKRVSMERALIKLGISLIINRERFTEGKDIIDEFNLILV